MEYLQEILHLKRSYLGWRYLTSLLTLALENEDYGTVEAADFLRDKCAYSDTLASDKVIDYVIMHKEEEGI